MTPTCTCHGHLSPVRLAAARLLRRRDARTFWSGRRAPPPGFPLSAMDRLLEDAARRAGLRLDAVGYWHLWNGSLRLQLTELAVAVHALGIHKVLRRSELMMRDLGRSSRNRT